MNLKKEIQDSIIQKKSDQTMVEEVYLQMILFLKSRFDILM
jgi:hypothetical protein